MSTIAMNTSYPGYDPGREAEEAVGLLKDLIRIPSYSFEEQKRADFIQAYIEREGVPVYRAGNNLAARCPDYDPGKPSLLLNSHIDTVRAAESYTVDPFGAAERNGRIYGLGSNDAGASAVCLTTVFLRYCREGSSNAGVNPVLLLTAEEERSGPGGMSRAIRSFGKEFPFRKPDFALIGEPTGMQAAVAERGLLVLDGTARGVSGHAARNEGVNALYIALDDIRILRDFRFEKHSPLMGGVKLAVTQIQAGTLHNVVPDRCTFVVDIRPTEQYSNPEILELLQSKVRSELCARNLDNRSSATPCGHRLLEGLQKCGIGTFVSPTTSDWMKIDIPAIKMGPGDSSRSHKADEYIDRREIAAGLSGYRTYIERL